MPRGLSVTFAIVLVLRVCEMSVYLTSYTWESYLQTSEAVKKAFDSDAKGMEILIHLSPEKEPVIGTADSSYTLEDFINEVIEYHETLVNESPVKSICIYFYETEEFIVVQKTIELLKRKEDEIQFPLWLRASLFVGVDNIGGFHPKFPEPEKFIEEALKLKRVVLGIRWVTHKCAEWETGKYEETHTKEAYDLLEKAKVLRMKDQEINFCLRGHYAFRSREALAKLFGKVNTTNPVTVTIYEDEVYWDKQLEKTYNCIAEPLITKEVREAINTFGAEHVYLQMGPETNAKLQFTGLDNPPRPDFEKFLTSATVKLNDLSMVMLIISNFLGIFVLC